MNKKEKSGLMIGFITDGMIPTKWMMRLNEMQNGIPSGIFWKYCWYEGKNYKQAGGYAKARQKVVEQARANNAKWLFFIDTDVFPPADVVTRLMSHGKPITCGIYYMKSNPAQPVIFKKMGDGPYWDYPVEALTEIEGSGLGCTLIDMDVFDKFEEAGLDFFQENWIHEKPDGGKVKVKIGEDHWFFMKAKELGYTTYCDTSVLCDHLDTNTGIIYPGEEEVEKIRKKILEKKGRTDVLKIENELFSLDPNKKTIVFYNATPSKFSGDELERRGVGGSEGDIISLAKLFAKNYNVIVFCDCPRPGVYDGVKYLHLSETEFMSKFKTDLFIASRNTQLLADVNFKEHFNVDKVCLWTHDLPESYVFDKLPQAIPNIDKVFALTNWHKQAIKDKFPEVPEEYWFYAHNGVDVSLFKKPVKRNPYKLIYSSTPFRGLDVLLEVFPKIKEFVPEAELHIFSSMKVYGDETDETKEWEALYEKAKNMDGVTYRGTVIRKELAKEMKESAILAYPNHYPETCCITAMEAVTAGTPIVTTKLAALPEIIPKGCGIFIEGEAHTENYKKEFINAVVGILQNPALWEEMHEACKGHDFSWETVSLEWIREFFPDDLETYKSKLDISSTCLPTERKTETKKKEKIVNPTTEEDKKERRLKAAKEEGWNEELVKYREQNGGNLNTPEYWDHQYKFEDDNKLDHRSDTRRWNSILDHIKDNDVILDYGCGMGEFLSYVKQAKPNVKRYGIDISRFALQKAEEKDPELSGRLTNNVAGLPHDAKEGYFNVVTCQHVLEHVDEPEEFVGMLKKLVAKDGKLILVVPINDMDWIEHQRIWYMEDIVELLGRFDCTYKLEHRKKSTIKSNGEPVEEVIAVIKFGGD